MSQNILEIYNLFKSFNNNEEKATTVIKDISFQVQAGEFLTVMGPSGSGKSTLLYCVSGMDSIDSGQVVLDDQEISGLSEEEASKHRLTKMGFIFQSPTMLKNLNIIDNIVLPAFKNGKEDKKAIYEKAKELMEATSIGGLTDRTINKVSGGELQRASICRAMINQPAIIFGDEPTGALNSKTSLEIINLLKKINDKGSTIILVTHDPKVAMASKRVIFMKDGQISSDLKIDGLSDEERREKVMGKMLELNI